MSSSDWTVGNRHESKVHFEKLIKDLRDQFPYNSLTAFVVETFANSLDAGATRIDIFVGTDTIKILDNGKGMRSDEFMDYHNLASLNKTRGEGIGFAGVGAKIFLDKVYHIITETKSKQFHAASNWAFHGDSLRFVSIPVQNRVRDTGTYVEVKIKDSDSIKNLTTPFIKLVIQQHYNAILLGYYGEKCVTINNEVIKPFTIDPNNIELKKDFNIKIGRNLVNGYLIKTKTEINELFQGPQIIVNGKTIMPYWFKQYPTYSELFTGFFISDHLIEVLTTSKSDFDKTSQTWKQFNSKVGRVVGSWLNEIGAKAVLPKQSDDLNSISQELEKTVNELLKLPEFVDIANKIFQNLMDKDVLTKKSSGGEKGLEQEGGQQNKNPIGDGNNESTTPLGPDDDRNGVAENSQGNVSLDRVRRRVKGGIKISFDVRPDDLLEAWIDPSTQTVTINQGHPSWKVAEKLNIQSKSENVTFYHMLRSIFKVLAEEANLDNSDKTVKDLFKSLYERLPGAQNENTSRDSQYSRPRWSVAR